MVFIPRLKTQMKQFCDYFRAVQAAAMVSKSSSSSVAICQVKSCEKRDPFFPCRLS